MNRQSKWQVKVDKYSIHVDPLHVRDSKKFFLREAVAEEMSKLFFVK